MKRIEDSGKYRRGIAVVLTAAVLFLLAGYLPLMASVWQMFEQRVAAATFSVPTPNQGEISAFAGIGGLGGFSGDGGQATLAKLHGPSAVAVAADGTVYLADLMNYRVRKISGG